MKQYELALVFDGDIAEATLTEQMEWIKGVVATHSGDVSRRDDWGRRALAYPINKKTYGVYSFLNISGDNKLVANLRRLLEINENVLRYSILNKDKFTPDAKAIPPEDIFGGIVIDDADFDGFFGSN